MFRVYIFYRDLAMLFPCFLFFYEKLLKKFYIFFAFTHEKKNNKPLNYMITTLLYIVLCHRNTFFICTFKRTFHNFPYYYCIFQRNKKNICFCGFCALTLYH